MVIKLKANHRTEAGKKVRALRASGVLPSVVYGPKVENEQLSVSLSDFEKAYKQAGESSLIHLEVGSKEIPVLIHDIERDPVTLKPIHADFYAVDMKKAIHAKVPLVFVGEAPAVKSEGGILLKVMQEIEVEAMPEDLPHEISVSIESMKEIGARITVSDISMPKGVKAKAHTEDIVAIIEAPRAEEEVAPAPVAEEGVVEVKTEREVKAAEKAAKEEEAKAAEA